LNKPGKLTGEEFDIVKSHAIKGSEMMNRSLRICELATIISRYHHERWNGQNGYEGLHGYNIPWAARITGVADVVDALLSERPYKSRWSFQETMEYIRQERGLHFDPLMVDALIDCAHEIEAIYSK
jgi:response regulator RpfG family c-di-GMP phosphodiesterase